MRSIWHNMPRRSFALLLMAAFLTFLPKARHATRDARPGGTAAASHPAGGPPAEFTLRGNAWWKQNGVRL
jgi:hypothetical protein